MVEVHFFALGLNPEVTGIERLACAYALDTASALQQLDPEGHLVLHVDEDARWADPVADAASLRRHPRIPARVAVRPRRVGANRVAAGVTFSGPIRVANKSARTAVVIHDWRPFTDSTMSLRARVLWSTALWRNLKSADQVLFYSESIMKFPPPWIQRMSDRSNWRLIALPSSPFPSKLRSTGALVPARSPYLLAVGSNQPHKRLDLLSRAMESTDLDLVVVGTGTEALQGRRTRALGRVSDADLADLYRNAAAVVIPSSTEGYGLPILEAAMFGKPVLASEEVRRLHTGGANSLLPIDCTSEEALAASIQRASRLILSGSARQLPLSIGDQGSRPRLEAVLFE